MADGTLIFDTKIDNSGFERGAKELKSNGEKTANTVGNIMKGIIGADIVKSTVGALVDFGEKAITLASDLQEVQNVVDVTFVESAEDVNSFAKSASESFGLSELQAKQYTGTLGAMVKSMGISEAEAKDMSISMTGLVGDMASFYNLDHDTAFEKIRSGLSGETEPLKQLGINMSVANLEAYRLSKGIKTAYDAMTEAERVQLRYSFIMDQTNDAQGDFSRTQDALANQMRILRNNIDTLAANIGNNFLPIASAGVRAINNLLGGILSGDETESETVKELNSAIESLETLETAAQTAKDNFTRNVIKINVEYQEAQTLIDKLEVLQNEFGETETLDLGTVNLKVGDANEDVAELQTALTDLGYIITDPNGTFGASTADAVKQFQTSAGIAVDAIVGKQTKAALDAALIAASSEDLKAVTDELIALYPELEQYVGEDGLLSIEADQVRDLTEAYKELAVQQAFQAKITELGSAYSEGKVNLEVTKQTVKDAEEQYSKLEEEKEKITGLRTEIDDTINSFDENISLGQGVIGYLVDNNDTEKLNTLAAAAQSYFDVLKSFPEELFDELSNEGYDISSILGVDGDGNTVLDISQIENNEAALDAFNALILKLRDTEMDAQIEAKEKELEAISSSIEEANAEMAVAQEGLDKILKEMETTKKAQESFMQELETDASETGTNAGKNVSENTASGIKNSNDTVVGAFKGVLNSVQATARNNPIVQPVQFSVPRLPTITAPGHATGLYRVPYDNYYARLHAGERVLTAAEARDYNRAERSGGTSAPMIIEQPAQTIVLEIDGNRLAETQVKKNRTALNNYSKKIAQGRGQR